MWLKIICCKDSICSEYIKTEDIKRVYKTTDNIFGKHFWVANVYTQNPAKEQIKIYRDTEEEIDKIIQSLLGSETIKEIE